MHLAKFPPLQSHVLEGHLSFTDPLAMWGVCGVLQVRTMSPQIMDHAAYMVFLNHCKYQTHQTKAFPVLLVSLFLHVPEVLDFWQHHINTVLLSIPLKRCTPKQDWSTF